MTAVTRDAIVKAAARAEYMDDRTRGGEGPFEWPEWEYLPALGQAIYQESALVTVLATLAALMPLVEKFEVLATTLEGAAYAERRDGHLLLEGAAFGKSIAYMDAANQLRKVIS